MRRRFCFVCDVCILYACYIPFACKRAVCVCVCVRLSDAVEPAGIAVGFNIIAFSHLFTSLAAALFFCFYTDF